MLVSSPAHAVPALPKDSPLRMKDCVAHDRDTLDRLKSLREKVRAEFARNGGARAKNQWTDEWDPFLGLGHDWTLIIGDEGVVGLDSPSLGRVAFIPRAWTVPASAATEGMYDPVTLVERAREEVSTWAPDSVSSLSFFHPTHWDVRISSQADIGEGRRIMSRFYFQTGRPELRLDVSALPDKPADPRWFESTVGHAVLHGHSIVGSDTIAVYGRICRVSYLEREGWKDPESGRISLTAQTVVGCAPAGYSRIADDLLAVFETMEYEKSRAPSSEALESYLVSRRSFCTVNMAILPVNR